MRSASGSDRSVQLALLRRTIGVLASPADAQVHYLQALGTAPSLDELALEFDDAFGPLRHVMDDVGLSHTARERVADLDRVLTSMSDSGDVALWRLSALTDPRWDHVRRLSREVLGLWPTEPATAAARGRGRGPSERR